MFILIFLVQIAITLVKSIITQMTLGVLHVKLQN